MGGRGGSSGIGSGGSSGFDVTSNGKTTRYYFTSKNGQHYYQVGIGGTPQPTLLNMSASEFKKRVTSNGATVKNLSASERRKDQKAYKADRKATDAFLDKETASNRALSSGSKAAARSNRANRRSRG
ncbi:MAG: hypothetical protein Q4Q33_03885 [Eubacteriales bacterium]|nr:hypothetical protein [Eubacteriales bacterium]